jgi:hypothetical protein
MYYTQSNSILRGIKGLRADRAEFGGPLP